jgi:hypothetical protein
MVIHRDDRSERVMAAALSRRRVLTGLAGAAGLGLLGGARRAPVAAESHDATRYIGLAFGAIFPPDLPDGDGFGLQGGVTYRGVDGGLAAGILNQPLIAALGSSAERLVGGSSTVLTPLDGAQSQWAQTEFWHFPTDEDASAVRDIFGTPGINITTLPGGSDRGAFLGSLTPSGGQTIDARYVVFRFQSIVGRITRGWQYDAGTTPPDAGESVALLEDLRKVAVRRLTAITDPDYGGLATTVPTFPDLEVATNGGIRSPIDHWIDNVTVVDGRPSRLTFQTPAAFERFLENHADVEESFARTQNVMTGGGNPLLIRVDAYRFRAEAAAEAYFDLIGERTTDEAAESPDFAVNSIEPPPGLVTDVPTQWYENRLTSGGAETLGVRCWRRTGADVVGILVGSGPRPPEQTANPAYAAGLLDFGALGANLYHAWNDSALRSDPDFLAGIPPELEEFCRNWDELVAALDAR